MFWGSRHRVRVQLEDSHDGSARSARRTCVRISSTSLNPMVVSANLVWSMVTTFLLCSDTCLPPALRLDWVKACSWAIC